MSRDTDFHMMMLITAVLLAETVIFLLGGIAGVAMAAALTDIVLRRVEARRARARVVSRHTPR